MCLVCVCVYIYACLYAYMYAHTHSTALHAHTHTHCTHFPTNNNNTHTYTHTQVDYALKSVGGKITDASRTYQKCDESSNILGYLPSWRKCSVPSKKPSTVIQVCVLCLLLCVYVFNVFYVCVCVYVMMGMVSLIIN